MARLNTYDIEGWEIKGGFTADLILVEGLHDVPDVFVKAVLERTAVIIRSDGDPPELVSKDLIEVTYPLAIKYERRDPAGRFKGETAEQKAAALAEFVR